MLRLGNNREGAGWAGLAAVCLVCKVPPLVAMDTRGAGWAWCGARCGARAAADVAWVACQSGLRLAPYTLHRTRPAPPALLHRQTRRAAAKAGKGTACGRPGQFQAALSILRPPSHPPGPTGTNSRAPRPGLTTVGHARRTRTRAHCAMVNTVAPCSHRSARIHGPANVHVRRSAAKGKQ